MFNCSVVLWLIVWKLLGVLVIFVLLVIWIIKLFIFCKNFLVGEKCLIFWIGLVLIIIFVFLFKIGLISLGIFVV